MDSIKQFRGMTARIDDAKHLFFSCDPISQIIVLKRADVFNA